MGHAVYIRMYVCTYLKETILHLKGAQLQVLLIGQWVGVRACMCSTKDNTYKLWHSEQTHTNNLLFYSMHTWLTCKTNTCKVHALLSLHVCIYCTYMLFVHTYIHTNNQYVCMYKQHVWAVYVKYVPTHINFPIPKLIMRKIHTFKVALLHTAL